MRYSHFESRINQEQTPRPAPEMGFSRSRLANLILCVLVLNEFRPSTVTCQNEEGSQCLPKKTFVALLRLPEVNSNLAAYSRTARIIHDAKNRNDIFHLKALSSEEGEDAEICIPANLYVELFRNPAMRGHLSAIERAQKMLENPDRSYDEDEEVVDPRDLITEAEKRSLATLAKNDDLPVTIRDRKGRDDGDKRSGYSGDNLEAFLAGLLDEQTRRNMPDILQEYTLPNGEIDVEGLVRDYPQGKRNIASLARDYGLPSGKRNVASLARDFALPNGKRNIGALARERLLPSGKRNVASLARVYMLPQNGKRNVAALARDYSLPYGKRYLVDDDGFPYEFEEGKRSIAALARNGDWPAVSRRSPMIPPGRVIMRILTRHGRSLSDRQLDRDEPLDLQKLAAEGSNGRHSDAKGIKDESAENRPPQKQAEGDSNHLRANNNSYGNNGQRAKRQIDFSDEYPLPVMQNANVLDYEEMIEALTGQYPNTEKRFMGFEPEVQADLSSYGYPEAYQPSKRHIGALARQGWLPSFRAARFSRSPRYLVGRENSADGTSSDYPVNTSTRSLNPIVSSRTRNLQSLHGDCRHGFKRYLLLPTDENFLSNKIRIPRRIK